MEQSVVLCGYKRSPFHFAGKGALATVRPDDLATTVVQALVRETRVKVDDIEDLLLGCAFPEAEQGFNLARILVQASGLPNSIGGATINRFCGSSMTAIHMACGYIQMGAGEVFIAAGVESMTRIPMGGFNPMPNPKLAHDYPQIYIGMGETAENLAKMYQISRTEQDGFAALSQKKAAAARMEGKLRDEIVPIETKQGMVAEDGCIRPDTTAEGLGGLKPAFDENGSVTAGTSSPLTDGASAVLVASETYARAHHLPIIARIKSIATAGCAPEIMGIGPVPAAQKALARAGVTLDQIDLIELNEAFAAQSLSVLRELNADHNKVNIDGGAIAIGHPLGATGARITGKLATLLQRERKTLGLATMCIGGGQGVATVLEAV
jgi:acetyl-CoA acetyltransferase family protein